MTLTLSLTHLDVGLRLAGNQILDLTLGHVKVKPYSLMNCYHPLKRPGYSIEPVSDFTFPKADQQATNHQQRLCHIDRLA